MARRYDSRTTIFSPEGQLTIALSKSTALLAPKLPTHADSTRLSPLATRSFSDPPIFLASRPIIPGRICNGSNFTCRHGTWNSRDGWSCLGRGKESHEQIAGAEHRSREDLRVEQVRKLLRVPETRSIRRLTRFLWYRIAVIWPARSLESRQMRTRLFKQRESLHNDICSPTKKISRQNN